MTFSEAHLGSSRSVDQSATSAPSRSSLSSSRRAPVYSEFARAGEQAQVLCEPVHQPIATPNRAMRAALGQARRAAARAVARRCFFWGAAAGGGKDAASAALLAAATTTTATTMTAQRCGMDITVPHGSNSGSYNSVYNISILNTSNPKKGYANMDGSLNISITALELRSGNIFVEKLPADYQTSAIFVTAVIHDVIFCKSAIAMAPCNEETRLLTYWWGHTRRASWRHRQGPGSSGALERPAW